MNEYGFFHKQPLPIILKAGLKIKQPPLKFALFGFFVQSEELLPLPVL